MCTQHTPKLLAMNSGPCHDEAGSVRLAVSTVPQMNPATKLKRTYNLLRLSIEVRLVSGNRSWCKRSSTIANPRSRPAIKNHSVSPDRTLENSDVQARPSTPFPYLWQADN